MDTKELSKLLAEKFFVLVNEEYGYRYWFWFPNMKDKQELISWWENLDTVDYFFHNPGDSLEGQLFEADDEVLYRAFHSFVEDTNIPYVFLHCDDDSWLRVDEQLHDHKGFKPRE